MFLAFWGFFGILGVFLIIIHNAAAKLLLSLEDKTQSNLNWTVIQGMEAL